MWKVARRPRWIFALLLAAITREFELEVAPRHRVWPLLRVTLRPACGLPMTVRRRPVSANPNRVASHPRAKRAGLRPETPPRGSAPWIPAKGSGPWNPLMGMFSGEGLP